MYFIHPKKIKRQIKRYVYHKRYPFAAILMLHRIDTIDYDRLWYNEHLKLAPEFLERFIVKAKEMGFTFVSMDQLKRAIEKREYRRKWIVITLDDGYRDNFLNGLPIFKKHNVPFCIFVATGMVEKQMIYWWYIIEDLILANDKIILDDGREFACSTKEEKEQAFLDIREIILKKPQDNIGDELVRMFNNSSINLNSYNDTLPLTWDDLKILKEEPLATIGCHTHSHLSFAGCSDEEIILDIKVSQKLMRENAGIDMKHFAFPFGDECAVQNHHKELLRECGFMTICTTADGVVGYNTDVLSLPRIFVTEKNILETMKQLNNEL